MINCNDNLLPIDHLGHLRAQIADLQEQAKDLEIEIKAAGPGVHEGHLYRTTVSEVVTDRVDWKGVAVKLNPSRQLITAHTSEVHSIRLTVSARRRAAA